MFSEVALERIGSPYDGARNELVVKSKSEEV